MLQNIIQFFSDHKRESLLVLAAIALALFYPSIFKTLYDSGRDFGKSVVNAILP